MAGSKATKKQSNQPDKKLTEKQVNELWQQYSEHKDLETKNKLIVHYIHLVRNIVLRMMPTYHNYNEYDDLLSCGVIGLIDAVEKFDLKQNVKFETYATMRIRGEILDQMRKIDWAPSSLRRKINAISNAYETLEAKHSRRPTEDEVAKFLKMDKSKMQQIMSKSHIFNLMYFEDAISENYNLHELASSDSLTPEETFENKEVNNILSKIIEDLPDNEKLVISLYYYEEFTLKEIAEVLKVSESRVSQIHSKVLDKMNKQLKAELN